MATPWYVAQAEAWRRRAAELREHAGLAHDSVDGEQLLVFARDCEELAATLERMGPAGELRA